jgi:spore germination protein YaaH
MIPSARGRIVVVVVAVLALALTISLITVAHASSNAPAPASGKVGNAKSPQPGNRLAHQAPVLAPATVPPAPAPTSVATAPPLAAQEVFGFAPYWSLGQSAGFNVTGLSTLAYFSVGINANGTLNKTGAGWNGYESQALSTLITRAHAAGKRMVLTVNDFDQRSLDALTSNPAAATTLSSALVGAVEAKNFDGVNLDLEGAGNADQAGLTRLVSTVSSTLHQVNAHWQVTMDTYASSAGDPGGFFNIPALAGAVDAFFVMQYSPNLSAPAQAASPLTSSLFSDQSTVTQYSAAVPADKVILGAPLFGDDWPTTGNTLADTASGPATTEPDSQIMSGHPIYWDPVTNSAWTAYQVGTQWHEAFFDDPTSMFQIAFIAAAHGLRGTGLWALGMEGADPAMVNALNGIAPHLAYATPGAPSSSTPTTAAPAVAAPAADPQATTTTTASGGTPAASASGTTSAGGAPSAAALPSFVGAFEAESLTTIEGATPSATPPGGTQSVTLCIVATPSAPNPDCAAPLPPAASISTTALGALIPPFPGATVAGLLTGLVIHNDATLSCLQNANQSAEFGASSAVSTTPELVVWQWPGNQQYDYVVATTSSGSTSSDCASATLAFAVPPTASTAG